MFGRAKDTARDERGQNLLEFAVVVLLLLLLFAGIADLGRAFYTYMAVANAAREGVRYYSRLPCTTDSTQRSELYDAVVNATIAEASANGININPTSGVILEPDPPTQGCQEAGLPVRVTAVYTFRSMLGALPLLGGGSYSLGNIQLSHTATMVNFGNDGAATPTPQP
jgi:Flp pilus assembly protein TadG